MTSEQAILRTTIVPGLIEAHAPASTPGPSTSRCSRSRGCTCPPAGSCPTSAGGSAGVVAGGYEVVKGVLETLYDALGLELRVDAARTSCSTRARRPRRTRAGSASFIRRCSRERGVRSSSTSRPVRGGSGAGRVRGRRHLSGRSRTSRSPWTRMSRSARSSMRRARRRGAASRGTVFDVYRGDQVRRAASRSRSISPSSRRSARSRDEATGRASASSPRSRSASAPSCAREQTDRPRARVETAMRRSPSLLSLFRCRVARGRVGGEATPAQATQLFAAVGPGFTINLRDRSGARVTKLDPGAYRSRSTTLRGAQLPPVGPGREPLDRDRRRSARQWNVTSPTARHGSLRPALRDR